MSADFESHLDESELENYSMDRASPEATERIEMHLLTCEACRSRVREFDEFLQEVRAALTGVSVDPIETVHVTEHGPIILRVEPFEGGWKGCIGDQVTTPSCSTLREANTEALLAFRRLFPNHRCGRCCTGMVLTLPLRLLV